MKISIIGLTKYENLGDQFIGKTVDYIVKEYGQVDTELLDFEYNKSDGNASLWSRITWKAACKLKLKQLADVLLAEKYKSFYQKKLFKKLEKSDAVIFSGGSFKYGTQDVWVQYSTIIDYANEHNIPVMFNAMNVQKYDEGNFKCRYLKKHLNKPCVKYFSSRDGQAGVDRLKSDYVEKEIRVLPAADPAFWIPETYHVARNEKSNTIGINVISPDIFLRYGGKLQPEDVKEAYIVLINRLKEKNFKWQIFTNGMQVDNIFALEIAKICNAKEDEIHIPKSDFELASMEANYMAVFGSRLHSMICAYSLGVPVAGFIWDEKITHFAEMAKLETVFLAENEVNGEAMFNVLMKAVQTEDNPENRIYWKETTPKAIFEFLDSIEC
ncbi:polysaccharide pyruvyl transferase family protein [Lacrimispora indolis]|uniref:polysaccharide pyruvyl transferase family protein n=1 Tax=Lacrimispora indolis TaxID=69825 RepID=UPI00356AACF1